MVETWIILAEMDKKLEGSHTAFLRQITGKQALQIVDGTWETTGAGVVWEAVGKKLEMTYIGRQQATMELWVELQLIFEVCAGDKDYEGGGRRREAWWRQEATEKKLWATLEVFSRESNRRRI